MFKKLKSSWLARTGQIWKILIFDLFICLDMLLFILMVWNINDPKAKIFISIGLDDLQIRTAFLTVGVIALAQLFLAIKCPACKKRPIYYLIKKSDVNKWVTELITFKSCPICGYDGNLKIKDT